MIPQFLQGTSNFAHKVRQTKLPPSKAMMPLYEAVSNSIHAIEEAREAKIIKGAGKVRINLIRTGDQTALTELSDIDNVPIKTFEIIDNGIGINDANFEYFRESETDHKLEIGGKGVGRFVCLKAFKRMFVESVYLNGGGKRHRSFEFRAAKEPFEKYADKDSDLKSTGTKITLEEYKDDYKKFVPRSMANIARGLVLHFQLYFIEKTAPEITIHNQNGDLVNAKTIFESEFLSDIKRENFNVGEYKFKLYLTKSTAIQGHKIHFCAHNRSVKEESLFKAIPDLGKYQIKEDGELPFYYQAFIVGDSLDEYVDTERIGFRFPVEDSEDVEESGDLFEEESEELSLRKIREKAVATIEELLSDYLDTIRQAKLDSYKPIIDEDLQQYKYVFELRKDDIKSLPPGLSKGKLDLELYKIEQNWMREVKEEGIVLLEHAKDVTELDEYKERYEKFLTDYNAIGQTELARYVVHRKTIIEVLRKMLQMTREGKFPNEDMVHNIFFPIRTVSDEVPPAKQNLWLLDERLTFHSFLASDKSFLAIKDKIQVAGENRTDLLIYNEAFGFAEATEEPFNSFTIVEFKKPQRNNYKDYDPKMNPLEQSEKYIKDILGGKVKRRDGRFLNVDPRIPFYIYIVCDITPTFREILADREFTQTPDGLGYFRFKDKQYSAYFEVLPYEKVLLDAEKRNKILFEKLLI